MRIILSITAGIFVFACAARADIFQWEYINPADPSQGKRQSATLAPGGAGVDALPGANLIGRNLTMAYLIGTDLMSANGFRADLTSADLSQANLTNASFHRATLTDANFNDADIRGACFCIDRSSGLPPDGTGITLSQLYSTASYIAHDLTGIRLWANNLSGGNFASQNLTNASFQYATLADADFSRANLTNVDLGFSTLTGANLSLANLANAYLNYATLTGADFTGAEVRGANLAGYFAAGITLAQLYSTASYQAKDLSGIGVGANDLAGGNFGGQNLTNARFDSANLTGTIFSQANLTNATFGGANLTGASFRDANLANADFAPYSYSAQGPSYDPSYATVTGADFTGAEVRGANLAAGGFGTGITLAQLNSTASYQAKDLSGIGLGSNDLAGGNFAGQNLTNASFNGANLTDADFTDAEVRGARFAIEFYHIFEGDFFAYGSGITRAQLYSTASYQARDLSGIDLSHNNFAGGNFANQDLNNANFSGATLTGADFTGAEVRGAIFGKGPYFEVRDRTGQVATYGGTGVTLAQVYSTASYQAHDLSGIRLDDNYLAGANFSGQNLTNASFRNATLTDADFTGAEVRGASLSGITLTQLYSTASYQAHDLSGIALDRNDLVGGNFTGQNLTNANFRSAALTGADFTDAEVRGADFGRDFGPRGGIAPEQLYSTASYQSHDLTGIQLYGKDLRGWNFAGQKLVNADLRGWTNGADFTAADARGADVPSIPADAITTNLISQYGRISGLDLVGDELLVVRDYDGGSPYNSSIGPPIPITVDQHLVMGPGSALRMVFEADAWDSTISFAPGIPVTLGGTLELTFAADVNLATQVGRTFDLFDWTGVTPTGVFTISSPYVWDLSNLFTAGEVTLLSIPEPASIALTTALGIFILRRGRRPQRTRRLSKKNSKQPNLNGHKKAQKDTKNQQTPLCVPLFSKVRNLDFRFVTSCVFRGYSKLFFSFSQQPVPGENQ